MHPTVLRALRQRCAARRLATLVASSEPGEAKTFFLKMQGDYYRHLADACQVVKGFVNGLNNNSLAIVGCCD